MVGAQDVHHPGYTWRQCRAEFAGHDRHTPKSISLSSRLRFASTLSQFRTHPLIMRHYSAEETLPALDVWERARRSRGLDMAVLYGHNSTLDQQIGQRISRLGRMADN